MWPAVTAYAVTVLSTDASAMQVWYLSCWQRHPWHLACFVVSFICGLGSPSNWHRSNDLFTHNILQSISYYFYLERVPKLCDHTPTQAGFRNVQDTGV